MSSPAEVLGQDGYALLKGVLPSDEVEEARQRCLLELSTHTLWFGGGTIAGHISYAPPPDLDLLGKLITNRAVVSYISDVLGSDFHVLSVGCNVNLPGSSFQPAHADGGMDCDYLVVNLPLGDVSEVNGSLELFAGTHRTNLTYAAFVRACRGHISRRANTLSGDVIVRHPNMWHRGTPNRSAVPRFMMAVIVAKQSPAHGAIRLSPDNIALVTRAGIRAHMIASDAKAGEFRPTYFRRTASGIAKELVWRYTPPLYNLLRRVSPTGV